MKNESELLEIFGTVKISQWNLAVPYWSDKDLIKHANVKALEVQERHCSHAEKEFAISILTDDDFELIEILAQLDIYQFDLPIPPLKEQTWPRG